MQMSVSRLLNSSYCAKLVTMSDCIIIAELLLAVDGRSDGKSHLCWLDMMRVSYNGCWKREQRVRSHIHQSPSASSMVLTITLQSDWTDLTAVIALEENPSILFKCSSSSSLLETTHMRLGPGSGPEDKAIPHTCVTRLHKGQFNMIKLFLKNAMIFWLNHHQCMKKITQHYTTQVYRNHPMNV